MGSSNENSGFGPVQNPWDRTRVPGRVERRQRRGRRRRARRPGRSAPTPAARSASRPRSAASSGMKPTYGAVSRYGMIAFASSLDQCGPLTRDVTDAALLLRHLEGRDPCDSTSLGIPGEIALPSAERLDGMRFGVCGLEEEGSSPAWPSVCEHDRADRGARRRGRAGRPAERRARPRRLLRDRARRGERQPRPLRRRAVRPARRGDGDLTALYEQTRARRLRRRGQAPHHDRHLRALVGLLRRLLRQGAEGPHEHRRGLRGGVREGRPDRHARPRRPSRSSSASGRPIRSRCTCRTTSRCRCRSPASPPSRSRAGSRTACRWASRSRAPRSASTRILDAAHALEQAIGFEGIAAGDGRDDFEPVIGIEIHVPAQRRARRCSAAARSRSATSRTRTPARSASAIPARCRSRTPRPCTSALMIAMALRLRDRAALDLPPQELLLSRPAEGLPDQPVRHPARRRAAGSGTCASTACTSRRTPRSSSTPASSGRIHGAEASVVDFNRGGTPLVEIVTEPDLRSAAEAAEFGAAAAGDAAAHGRLRREHGGGLAADGRERVDPAGRRRRRSARRPSSRT